MMKPASTTKRQESVPVFELDDDGEEYMSVGTDGVLAASEKLLAINRGLAETDERDSLKFQKILRPHSMLRESIKMDAGKVARQMMYQAARRKNLSSMQTAAFDPYVERLLVGNPLTSPLEEINPMQLTESARRITKMGPGGLGSSESITEEAQAVHPSQFGFISPIEGPECFSSDTQIFTSKGWVDVASINTDTELACRVDGRLEFHKPERVIHEPYKGIMYGVKNMNTDFLVTPGHRLIGYTDLRIMGSGKPAKVTTAEEYYGKVFKIPCAHEPYIGSDARKTYKIGGEHEVTIEDWCSILGWFLAEGNVTRRNGVITGITITQSEDVHPDEFAELRAVFDRANIPYKADMPSPSVIDKRGYKLHVNVRSHFKPLCNELSCYNKGCYDKWIPEEIFEWSVSARQALLDALMKGDGRINKTHTTYCTVSKKLADSVERLMISLGYCVTRRLESDKRPHVKTDNYAVCALKTKWRHTETSDKRYAPYWYKQVYEGTVHCATVPGGMLYTRRNGKPGVWTGNSERAGIDVRASWGVKLGSNGRLYQKFYDRRSKKYKWMSPEDISTLTVKIPD